MKKIIALLTVGMLFANVPVAHAATCRDVTFTSIQNTTNSVIRITKVRYRDFEDNRDRTKNFNNRTLGRAGETGHRVGIQINLSGVRNERVGQFEFQYQRQTAPPNVFGASSWGQRRWASAQGNIPNCENNARVGAIRIPN